MTFIVNRHDRLHEQSNAKATKSAPNAAVFEHWCIKFTNMRHGYRDHWNRGKIDADWRTARRTRKKPYKTLMELKDWQNGACHLNSKRPTADVRWQNRQNRGPTLSWDAVKWAKA